MTSKANGGLDLLWRVMHLCTDTADLLCSVELSGSYTATPAIILDDGVEVE